MPQFPSDKPPSRSPLRATTKPQTRPTTSSSRHSSSSGTTDPRHLLGARAEDAAANYFELQGYSILARNLHVGRAEIDLLVQQDDVIVVVEVRTRGPSSYQRAFDSITSSKRRRLRTAGESLWRRRFLKDERVSRMRFDAVAVSFDDNDEPIIEHVRAAF